MTGFEGEELAAPVGEPTASMAPRLRVVRIERFEAAVPLADEECEAYRRRFCTLFVDDDRARRGGLGNVAYAQNALGEKLALKTVLAPACEEGEDEESFSKRVEVRRAAFRQEYEGHRALAGFRGVPRLFGYGFVEGEPAIVMEWIEGETLREVRAQLSADDAGRVSPLTVARLGRDLFDLLTRIDDMGEGFAHRDISPSNVMVRTGRMTVRDQAEEGSFDLCLVDFGSAASTQRAPEASFTARVGVARLATPGYAPPEMLPNDIPNLAARRLSSAVDVYAAASVLFELACGELPFDISGEKQDDSPYRVKVDEQPRPFVSTHQASADLSSLMRREPDVAVVAGKVAIDLGLGPNAPALRDALMLVDEQLADVLAPCLHPDQRKRPSSKAMRDGLSAFCNAYGQNVARALRGEPLIPCNGSASWLDAASPFALRRIVRTVGKALAFGVLLVVAVATGLLVDGAAARISLGSGAWEGRLNGLAVAAALLIPALCAYVVRKGERGTRAAFLRGTFALLIAETLLFVLVSLIDFEASGQARGIYAALFASAAATWCPIVLDYATTVVPALIAERKRRLRGSGNGALGAGTRGGAVDAGARGAATLPRASKDTMGERSGEL